MLQKRSKFTDIPDSFYDEVTGVILAGGQGKRMGMVDKGLQLFNGRPMVEHVIKRLRPQVKNLIVNANRNHAVYASFRYPVYADNPLLFSGPLAGFLTGLRHCETLYLVTVPCDTPFLPKHLVKTLFRSLHNRRADLAVAVSKIGQSDQVHPVFCLMKTSLKPHLEDFLENGGRKIDEWYASLTVAMAYFDDTDAFENINTLDELNKAQHIFALKQENNS